VDRVALSPGRFGAAYQVAQDVVLRASGNYVEAQDTKNDVPLPFTPPLRGLARDLPASTTCSTPSTGITFRSSRTSCRNPGSDCG